MNACVCIYFTLHNTFTQYTHILCNLKCIFWLRSDHFTALIYIYVYVYVCVCMCIYREREIFLQCCNLPNCDKAANCSNSPIVSRFG